MLLGACGEDCVRQGCAQPLPFGVCVRLRRRRRPQPVPSGDELHGHLLLPIMSH